jgi:DNA-directed RNA polymerase alpha subunit
MNKENDFPKIGQPALRALHRAGYTRPEHLGNVSEAELSKLHGVGPKALGILKEALKAKGLNFK